MKSILIMGAPGSGKSTIYNEFKDTEHIRFNRDSLGGTLKDLAKNFSEIIKTTTPKTFIFDNLFSTKESRAPFIEISKKNGVAIKCIWLKTSIENSQFNAASRMYKKYQMLMSPAEMKKTKDPNSFPPLVQFKYRKEFQPPSLDEGFDEIEEREFVRTKQESIYRNKGLLLDYDGTLRDTISGNIFPKSPDDIRILENRRTVLDKYIKDGYTLVGVSNQSGVHKGDLSEEIAKACFDKTNELLGLDIPVLFCPHQSNPISCYCRKPMPGFGVVAIEKYKLNINKTIMVGDMTTDETFAKRCGFKFIHTDRFFV